MTPLLKVEDVAELLGESTRSVHEKTRRRTIPFRRLPGTRRCLFVEAELVQWIDAGGTLPLEVIEGDRGSVVVRIKSKAAA